MKSLKVALAIFSLMTTQVFAGATCDTEKFKKQYIDLQNALRYSGKKIEYKNGKIVESKEAVSDSDAPGKKVEQALYNNYLAALGKIKKIYDYMKSPESVSAEDKTILSNESVTKFFKEIDPNTPRKTVSDVNIDKLIEQLKKVKNKDFSLNENDAYLLRKLIAHSQDRICTLEDYVKTGKATTPSRKKYLDDLKVAPINRMITSLREMAGTEDLKFSDQDLAIEEAVKEGINNLHKTALECKGRLFSIRFNEPVQSCNYNKFIQALSTDDSSFRPFEAILHFINANQNATMATTSLNLLDKEFKADVRCTLDPKTKTIFVQNLPIKNNTIDPAVIRCVKKGQELSGKACISGMTIELVDGKGHNFTAKKDSGIEKLSIENAMNCSNTAFEAPVLQQQDPPVVPPAKEESAEDKCRKDSTKEWKNGTCVPRQMILLQLNLYKCSADNCRNDIKMDGMTIDWDPNKKQCTFKPLLDNSTPIAFCSEDSTREPETAESCKAKKMEFRKEDRSCLETEASCKDRKLGFDPAKKVCIENEQSCKAQNLSYNSETKKCTESDESCKAKGLVYDEVLKACVESVDSCKKKNLELDTASKRCTETEQTCKAKNKELDASTKTCKDPQVTEETCKKQGKKFDADKKQCVDLSDKEKCDKKNADYLNSLSGEDSDRSDRYKWVDNKCVDAKEKKTPAEDNGGEAPDKGTASASKPTANKPVPGRFVPINIPPRQMYLLPGMP